MVGKRDLKRSFVVFKPMNSDLVDKFGDRNVLKATRIMSISLLGTEIRRFFHGMTRLVLKLYIPEVFKRVNLFSTLTTTPAPAGLVGSKRARRIFGRARVKIGVWVVKRSSHKGFLGEGKRLLFMADSDELISPAGSFKCFQKELHAELSK
ncbi:hypothetical protein AVEN_228239-1 [Araneus ventricosus]|uniref:Uncharacterized protein n=1 Tax=Araneus ventricosus TaxID=182803 RepID=A0A4Y2GA84_ARAVE|nr:hypothetical protein AVEN_23171-1 [Araneus ventricosus]GBM50281.1 hypothetical protein AVEN_228239-1 [Araneus ventricosus]